MKQACERECDPVGCDSAWLIVVKCASYKRCCACRGKRLLQLRPIHQAWWTSERRPPSAHMCTNGTIKTAKNVGVGNYRDIRLLTQQSVFIISLLKMMWNWSFFGHNTLHGCHYWRACVRITLAFIDMGFLSITSSHITGLQGSWPI